MKRKFLAILLLIILIMSSFTVRDVFAANAYEDGTINIDTTWTGTLGDSIQSLHATLTDIKRLNITTGQLKNDDVMWISGNLSNLETLSITANAYFEGDSLPDAAFSNNSGSTKMSKLKTVTIDIDDDKNLTFGMYAFWHCDELTTISLSEATTFVSWIFLDVIIL